MTGQAKLDLKELMAEMKELEATIAVPAKKALDKAKIKLMTLPNSTFISTILFSLKIKLHMGLPTAGVNHEFMYINPVWFLAMTDNQRVGLLCHEAWHVAWNHILRGVGLNLEKYNIAGDHVINLMLTDTNQEIPDGGCCDIQYRGMSTRQVYDLLPDDCTQNGQGGMSGDVIFGDKDMTDEEIQKIETELTNTIIKAMTAAKMNGDDPGSIPGELHRRIEELINPRLPWHAVLKDYMSAYAKNDYSYSRPNRRFFPDFYLPSRYSEALTNISAGMDLSGSMTDEMQQAILSELNFIRNTMQPEEMHILSFDTKIQSKHVIREGEDILDLKFKGGGGTKISPIIKYFNKIKPDVVILFTDYWVEANHTEPEFPVIWVILENESAAPTSGRIIHYTFD